MAPTKSLCWEDVPSGWIPPPPARPSVSFLGNFGGDATGLFGPGIGIPAAPVHCATSPVMASTAGLDSANPYPSSLPPPLSGTPRGRGDFEPGDRTFWVLPVLGPVNKPGAAIRASDWLYRSALLLRDLSARSWEWYQRVQEASMQYYHEYQAADPLRRGQIRPDLPEDLRSSTFARLESRAVQMLLQAVPESISNQAMATRTLSSVGILYQILKQYQPGGLQERQELLRSLTDLPPVTTAADAVLYLQGWFRHVSRARAMNVQLPDGSLLLSALDGLARPLLSHHAQVAFRLSLTRHTLRLDYQSEIVAVEEYARTLLAEFEVLALSGTEGEGGH